VTPPVIQVNLINQNFWFSPLTPLQTSSTFLNWYQERQANYDDYIDADYGQYKKDDNSSTTVNYEWHQDHDNKQWSEKKHGDKNKSLYAALLILIENNGIKLPSGLLANLKF
jgi:hypothetical protein